MITARFRHRVLDTITAYGLYQPAMLQGHIVAVEKYASQQNESCEFLAMLKKIQ